MNTYCINVAPQNTVIVHMLLKFVESHIFCSVVLGVGSLKTTGDVRDITSSCDVIEFHGDNLLKNECLAD